MLVECKECRREISDKAVACPHCGLPLKSFTKSSPREKSRKRKKLPNGFGQITKIKGNLRKPYRAMVTVGKTEEGKPICKLLKPNSYFETYNDAYTALVEYNSDPYVVNSKITCQEVFDKWFDEYSEKVSISTVRNITATWKYCTDLYRLPMNTIRIRHLREVMRKENINTKKRIKSLWNRLFDYAIEYEIVDKNYARMFKLDEKVTISNSHMAFTDEEMNILWENQSTDVVSMILIQCYMGWRPIELCELLVCNVDIENWNIVGGAKTEAGKKRRVHVIPAIRGLVKKWYDQANGSKYLFSNRGNVLTYRAYAYKFKNILESLGLNPNHRPHDPRKQFITMAKNAGMNEYAIKKIVGHSISDITEKIYTERNPDWLTDEILKIEKMYE